MKHFIITGKKHSGKTTYTAEVVKILKNSRYSVCGFINTGTFKEGVRDKFFIKSVFSDNEILFAERKTYVEGLNFGGYQFYENGFNFAEKEYTQGINYKSDFIVIDEVGKWELEKKGFFYLFEKMPLFSSMILVCRDEFIEEINSLVFNNMAEIISIDENINKTAEKIMNTYKNTNAL